MRLSELSQESFAELHEVTVQLESALVKAFSYDKLNYLMLMMVDPDVHFHIIPRYAMQGTSRVLIEDPGWPARGTRVLGRINETNAEINRHIMNNIILLAG